MSASQVPKRDAHAEVLDNAPVVPGVHRMVLALPGAAGAFRPGQFFQARVFPDGLDPLLRRPFSPSELGEDRLTFVYQVVGRGTRALAALHRGDRVDVLYPLGRGYTLPEKGGGALLVGGGCGSPTLAVLARALRKAGCSVRAALGAQSACSLLEVPALRALADRVALATDDTSAGEARTAVDAAARILDALDAPPARVYGCGPEPMLRALADLTAARGLPCEVSLEARMACGFGACMGCVVRVRDPRAPEGTAYERVCQDGPVFDVQRIVWD